MGEKPTDDEEHNQDPCYEIRIKGYLDTRWSKWFEDLTITLEDNGDTLLTGPVIDQAALHGLLKKVRDLGLLLVSVNPVERGLGGTSEIKPSNPIVSKSTSFKKKEYAMNTNSKSTQMNPKVLLVLLWVFYVVNFMYCDALSNLEPGVLSTTMTGYTAGGTVKITDGFVLGTAIMFEIPFLMIVLSWVLKYRANRWANIIASLLFVVAQISSLFLGAPSPMYIFYTTVEITGLLLITWYAWMWRTPEAQPDRVVFAQAK